MDYNTKQAQLIIHKKIQYALQTSQCEIQQKCTVQLAPISEYNKGQLWLLQGQIGGNFQIVNAFTDKLLTEWEQKLILENRSGSQHQTWFLQFVSNHQFYIKLTKQKYKYLCLRNGNLVFCQCQSTSTADLWLSQPILDNSFIKNTSLIISTDAKKMMEVPSGSRVQGSIVLINQPNHRFTQRWCIYRAGQIYVIKSLFTQMNLDIFQQRFQNENDVIQWSSNGKVNQFWFFQKIYGSVYRISTFVDKQLELGHMYGKIMLHKGRKFTWIIEGYFPQ